MIEDTTRLHPAATGSPTPEYKPRNPRKTPLWQILDSHFDTFLSVYEDRFEERYGYLRPAVDNVVRRYHAALSARS